MVPHRLFEELWRSEAPICPQVASWAAQLSPRLDGESLLSTRSNVSSTACRIESLTWKEHLCQQQRQTTLLLDWLGKQYLLQFLCRDAHHVTRRCSSLSFGLPVCDGRPLVVFNEIGVNPHNPSLRSKSGD